MYLPKLDPLSSQINIRSIVGNANNNITVCPVAKGRRNEAVNRGVLGL